MESEGGGLTVAGDGDGVVTGGEGGGGVDPVSRSVGGGGKVLGVDGDGDCRAGGCGTT